MYNPADYHDTHRYRPAPVRTRRPERPWVVPVALAAVIVLLLVALVILAGEAPTISEPAVPQTLVQR